MGGLLTAVLSVQVGAKLDKAEVRVSELPLDYDERDTFVRHFDRVGVSQLVGRDRRLTPAVEAA